MNMRLNPAQKETYNKRGTARFFHLVRGVILTSWSVDRSTAPFRPASFHRNRQLAFSSIFAKPPFWTNPEVGPGHVEKPQGDRQTHDRDDQGKGEQDPAHATILFTPTPARLH